MSRCMNTTSRSTTTKICEDEAQQASANECNRQFVRFSQWTWFISLHERWTIIEECLSFARILHDRVMALIKTSVGGKHLDLLEAEVRAKASVYEGKAVLRRNDRQLYHWA
jgi:hypothetical protein